MQSNQNVPDPGGSIETKNSNAVGRNSVQTFMALNMLVMSTVQHINHHTILKIWFAKPISLIIVQRPF